MLDLKCISKDDIMKLIFAVISLLFLFSQTVSACTTVFLNSDPAYKVVGRSTDLFTSDTPLVKALPRGISHNGEAGNNSLQWKSKYGSVVVTEFHSNAVSDGMNEKGLVVHLLYLSDSQYKQPNENHPQISNLLWAQYILDNYATVAEALKATQNLQIVATRLHDREWPLHLTMQDATGDAAIIEFIKGKMQVYHGSQYSVMTNEPAYNVQIENLKRYQGFGGTLPLPGDPDPLSRFVRASAFLKTLPNPASNLDAIAGMFSVMRTVMVPFGAVDTSGNKTEDAWATRWITVADINNKLYYFSSTTTPNIIWVDLNKLNFDATQKTLTIDPNKLDLVGDVTHKMN